MGNLIEFNEGNQYHLALMKGVVYSTPLCMVTWCDWNVIHFSTGNYDYELLENALHIQHV